MIKVTDEGGGFDAVKHFDTSDYIKLQQDRENIGKRNGGFGLAIAKDKLDSITYNKKGNAVLMVKKFRKTVS